MAPYIKINQLNMKNVAGSNVSLNVEKGEIIGITGLNGCGKSTFARYLAGIVRPDSIGRILINGLDPYSELDRGKISRLVGFVYQDPRTAVVFDNVGRDIAFGAENMGIQKDKILARMNQMMKRFNLSRRSGLTSSLSGSEEQRSAISAVMMMGQNILVLDEPFSMQSDKDAKRYLDSLINTARKKGQTIIIFSKKSYVMESVDRAYELTEGSLYEIDQYGMPQGISDSGDPEIVRSGDHFERGKYIDVNKKISVERFINGNQSKGENGLSLHNVYFGYGNKLLLDNVTARYLAGSAYRIVGEPGSGKTTYLQIIAGLLKPLEGEIFLRENSRIGYVFQYSEDGFVENTVLDDVMFGPMSDGHSKRKSRAMAQSILNFVGVKQSLWTRSPHSLSMGEQRLVSIAGALALNPDFLLIDEPFLGLDISSREHIEEIIAALCHEGKCVIVTGT
ncbi:ABC transporter [Lachnospiraceae bacterium NE2001]|nr:ABC transporter [Lachnospiraceae bacterium NE2001]